MRLYTKEEAMQMTFSEAKDAIYVAVYNAAHLLEKLEQCHKCQGNGHHARQKLARLAVEELKSRWNSPNDVPS